MSSFIKQFALEHPWMFFFLALAVIVSATEILHAVLFSLPNRLIRSRNIQAKGWPPAHCDADGDAMEIETTG
jgi:hypothetical protein